MPAIQAAREAARRAQCSNNFKQIGIGVHNFHDTLRGLPPISVGTATGNGNTASNLDTARPGFFVLLWPFIEQNALYEAVTTWGINQRLGTTFWVNGSSSGIEMESFRKGAASVNVYRCPSRRGSNQAMNPVKPAAADYGAGAGDSEDWGVMPGPCTDYTIPITNRSATMNYWYYTFNLNSTGHVPAQWGPIRTAIHSILGDAKTWQPRDTFSWLADGTTNQIILAEKHLHPSIIGECSKDGTEEPKGGAGNQYVADCSYFGSGYARLFSVAHTVRCRSGTDPVSGSGTWYNDDGDPSKWYIAAIYRPNDRAGWLFNDGGTGAGSGFGSYHPGICNFLFADGSIHALSITTPPRFLGMLTDVSDGNIIQIDW